MSDRFFTSLKPLPLALFRRKLVLHPQRSLWRLAAIIFLSVTGALLLGTYEWFVRDVYKKVWEYQDYRVDFSRFPPYTNQYHIDLLKEFCISYSCLTVGTVALIGAAMLIWERYVIDIAKTENFPSSEEN